MRPILIAECCQNHNGDREILKKLIHEAAENGADYVKIQAIRSRELTHRLEFDLGQFDENGVVKVIKRPFNIELERLKKLDLSLEDEQWFVEECWRAGIAPMTTAFTISSAREVKDMGYEAIKIASYDCASYALLKEVKKYWKKIFISTGATFDEEILLASNELFGSEYHFMHCITIYPTPLEELNLRRIAFLRKFSNNVGYSDHSHVATTGLLASKVALALGADSIERHFTVLEDDKTKDGPVSIKPHQLKELREFADLNRNERMARINIEFPQWELTLGKSTRPLSDSELLNRAYYRGRFASIVEGNYVYNWENKLF